MKRIVGAAIVAASLITLAACGSDDKGGSAGGSGGSDYCGLVEQYNEDSTSLDTIPFDNADQVKAGMQQMKSMMENLQANAPAEIKDDIKTVAGGFLAFIAVLEKYDYDMTKAATDPGFTDAGTALNSDEFNAATERINEYESTVCGINTDS